MLLDASICFLVIKLPCKYKYIDWSRYLVSGPSLHNGLRYCKPIIREAGNIDAISLDNVCVCVCVVVFDMRVALTEDHKVMLFNKCSCYSCTHAVFVNLLQELEESIKSWVQASGSGCSVDIDKDVCTSCTAIDGSSPWWLAFSKACKELYVQLTVYCK